jgi:hypothetical protein
VCLWLHIQSLVDVSVLVWCVHGRTARLQNVVIRRVVYDIWRQEMRYYLMIYISVGLIETCYRLAETHSELFLVWMGPLPFVVVLSPDCAQVGCLRDANLRVTIIY